MTNERLIRIIAGSFITLSVVLFHLQNPSLGVFSQPSWLWFTLFVGINLCQSGFTKWCLMDSILAKIRK